MRIYLLRPGEIYPPIWYGVSRYSTLLVQAIHDLDPSVDFVSFHLSLRGRIPAERQAALSRAGVRLIPARWPDLSGIGAYNRAIERSVVPRLVDRAGCDIVWGTNCVTLRKTGRSFRTAVTIHDLFLITQPELSETQFTRAVAPRLRQTVQEADVILADSHFTAQQIVELLDAPHDRVTVTYLGPSPSLAECRYDNPADVLAELGLSEPPILSVGTVEPRKNYETGLAVYRRLEERLGAVPPWAIVGRDGWKFEQFYAAQNCLGLQDRARVLQNVSDEQLAALYRTARCLFCPSLLEGFGLPVLEAMSLGVPVVSSTGGSLLEVGGNAVLSADPHDIEGLTDALARVLTDTTLAGQLVDRGRARAAEFTWKKAAERALGAFQHALM